MRASVSSTQRLVRRLYSKGKRRAPTGIVKRTIITRKLIHRQRLYSSCINRIFNFLNGV